MTMFKKTILAITFLMTGLYTTHAQQREQYSQYIMNNYFLNPAVGGAYSFWNFKAGFRQQWAGFEDPTGRGIGPRTFFTSLHGPIHHPDESKRMRKHKPHHGVGAYAYSDKTGPITYNGIFGTYSYHHKINKTTTASLGASLGVKEFKVNGDEVHFVKDPIDDLIGSGMESKLVPDMDIGLWVHNQHLFTGLTLTQVLNSDIPINNIKAVQNQAQLKFHYFYTFGWIFDISEKLHFSPSFMAKYIRPAPMQVDINLRVLYEDFLWVGVSYRNKDAVALVAEYVFNDKFEIGYSYDFTLSELRRYSSGSHEVILGLRWGKVGRSVYCPSKFW